MESDFYSNAQELDRLKALSYPSEQDVAKLRAFAARPEYLRYFLSDLTNATWVDALLSLGLLASPPEPVEVKPGHTYIPPWPVSRYLSQIAACVPQKVLAAFLELSTTNYHIHEDAIKAASRMPADVAARLVDRIVDWGTDAPSFAAVHELSAQLMEHLASGGEWEAVKKLLAALTASVQPSHTDGDELAQEVESRVERWMLERIIEGPVARLYRERPLDVLNVIDRQLRQAIVFERESGRWGDSDGSFLWRRAIEENDQNHEPREFKELLVVAIRDILGSVSHLHEVMERTRAYLDDEHSIFRRLAIHQIRTHPKQYRAELQRLFSDASYLRDLLTHHEYYVLIESAFGLLAKEAQLGFLDALAGEALQEYLLRRSRQFREEYNVEPEVDELARWRDRWLHPFLWALRDHLPEPHRAELERLVSTYGEPDHPEFLIWTGPVWTSAGSEQGSEEDRPLSPEELVARVASAKPTDDPSEPPHLALGSLLLRSLVADPESYVGALATFLEGGLSPMYWHYVLSGLQTAFQSGKDLDCDVIVGFCEGVLATAKKGWPPAHSRLEPDADTTLGDVAWLLREAVLHRDRGISASLGPKVRDILSRLLGWQMEEPHSHGSHDPILLALNSRHGRVLHALVAYALWYARQIADRAPGERLESQVRGALTTTLTAGSGVDPVVHAIFATYLRHLHYLGAAWLEALLPLIFPEDVCLERWRWVSVAAHVAQGTYYEPLYPLLQPHLLWAVDTVRPPESVEEGYMRLERLDTDLARYLAGAYVAGAEPLDQDGVLRRFLARAPLDARQEIIRTLGRWLDQTGQHPEVWTRLKDYWEQRLLFAETEPQAEDRIAEVATFTEWLANVPEKPDALLPMVERTVAFAESFHAVYELEEYLEAQCSRYPREAARLLLELVTRSDDAPFLRQPKIRAVLEAALRSDDPAACDDAKASINELGYRGQYAYRDLLDFDVQGLR